MTDKQIKAFTPSSGNTIKAVRHMGRDGFQIGWTNMPTEQDMNEFIAWYQNEDKSANVHSAGYLGKRSEGAITKSLAWYRNEKKKYK